MIPRISVRTQLGSTFGATISKSGSSWFFRLHFGARYLWIALYGRSI